MVGWMDGWMFGWMYISMYVCIWVGLAVTFRIREANKILLAQAYSPHLFRQGVLPGPGLLLEVLLGKKTTSDAKAAWKKYEKEKSERAKAPFLEISCLLGLRFGSLDSWKTRF